SCPFRLLHTFHLSGPRGVTPAFEYGTPHSGARGTLTLLSNALLSAHYIAVRLPAVVHEVLTAHRLLLPARLTPLPAPAVSPGRRTRSFSACVGSQTPQDRCALALSRAAILPSDWTTPWAS